MVFIIPCVKGVMVFHGAQARSSMNLSTPKALVDVNPFTV